MALSATSVRWMERRTDKCNIDLDKVASLIEENRPRWKSEGFASEPLKWTDNDEGCPFTQSLRVDVRRPRSLGLFV